MDWDWTLWHRLNRNNIMAMEASKRWEVECQADGQLPHTEQMGEGVQRLMLNRFYQSHYARLTKRFIRRRSTDPNGLT